MKIISTTRPLAVMWNGREITDPQPVEKPDPAFNDGVSQIVGVIDGQKLYFFADEVISGPTDRTVYPTPAADARTEAERQRGYRATDQSTEAERPTPGQPYPNPSGSPRNPLGQDGTPNQNQNPNRPQDASYQDRRPSEEPYNPNKPKPPGVG